MMHFHRYLIAVVRIAVNHGPGNGTAPDPTVWCVGAILRRFATFLLLLVLTAQVVLVGHAFLLFLFVRRIVTPGLALLVF